MAKKDMEKVEAHIPEAESRITNYNKRRNFDPRWLFVILAIIVVLIGAIFLNIESSPKDAAKIIGTIDIDNDDEKINWDRYQDVDIELNGSVKITKSGNYHITGALDGGLIEIDAGIGEVRLILDNVVINNPSGPAIACYSAEDLVIESKGFNYLTDGETYTGGFGEDVDGVIYSKADIAFWGDGSLEIDANYQDAIVGKDDVKFKSGSYKISAKDDGVRGKDSIYIVGGSLTIDSLADAMKTTNDVDTGKGFILIESGNLNISASGKGLDSIDSVLISDGEFLLDTADDTIHSNNYVGITGGNFNINSGDDGIHADRELIIDGGKVNITKAYEGLEAQTVSINGGEIKLFTSDDGINAGGGADSSAISRPGEEMFNADENCVLSINGGNVYINASGDGVDSNGWLYFNGGKTVIDGPTSNGNGALDSGMGIVMNGGEVLAIGSSGMAGTLGSTSSVFNVSVFLNNEKPARTKIEIRDSDDNTVFEHTSSKSFTHLAVGTEKFMLGQSYKIYLNDNEYETFTISGITTTVGNSNTNQNAVPPERRRR